MVYSLQLSGIRTPSQIPLLISENIIEQRFFRRHANGCFCLLSLLGCTLSKFNENKKFMLTLSFIFPTLDANMLRSKVFTQIRRKSQ